LDALPNNDRLREQLGDASKESIGGMLGEVE
jgi:hypothetical protein